MDKLSFAVLGAGSWGTALALQLAYSGHQVTLWGRDASQLNQIEQEKQNRKYLPNIHFPDNLITQTNLQTTIEQNQIILLATPSHSFEKILQQIKPFINTQSHQIISATKGLCHGELLHHIVDQYLPGIDYALLSGPSFSKEVAAKQPTTVIIASENKTYAEVLAQAFSSQLFRVYTSEDIIGVEIGGAVKNVLAVAVGISDGMGFGANARAALITRGLAEMQSLGQALGAKAKTLSGLSGLGDLVLTCTDNQSRNRRFGLAIGAGKNQQQAQEEIGQVVESIGTAIEIYNLAKKLNITMPITEQVYKMLHQNLAPQEAVKALFTRALKSE